MGAFYASERDGKLKVGRESQIGECGGEDYFLINFRKLVRAWSGCQIAGSERRAKFSTWKHGKVQISHREPGLNL